MRPTLSEHLTQLADVLRTTVVPAASDEFANMTLTNVIASLELMAHRWTDIIPFLVEDNDRTRRWLQEGSPRHGLPVPSAGSVDLAAPSAHAQLLAHNTDLREALAAALRATADDPAAAEWREAVRAGLRARAKQVPVLASSAA